MATVSFAGGLTMVSMKVGENSSHKMSVAPMFSRNLIKMKRAKHSRRLLSRQARIFPLLISSSLQPRSYTMISLNIEPGTRRLSTSVDVETLLVVSIFALA